MVNLCLLIVHAKKLSKIQISNCMSSFLMLISSSNIVSLLPCKLIHSIDSPISVDLIIFVCMQHPVQTLMGSFNLK